MYKSTHKVKKTFLAVLLSLIALCMSSCVRYVSSYKALNLIANNYRTHSEITFSSLEGRYVFRMKANEGGSEGYIQYFSTLEEGEINVYGDSLGLKQFLFNIKAGETKTDKGIYIERGRTVYIILETVEKSKGAFSFDLILPQFS